MQADGFSQFDCCQRSGEGRKRKGLKILLRHSALNIPPPPPPLIPVQAPSHLPHPLISSALFGFRLFWAKSFTSRFTQTLHLINFPSFSSPSTSSLLFLLSGSGLILSEKTPQCRQRMTKRPKWCCHEEKEEFQSKQKQRTNTAFSSCILFPNSERSWATGNTFFTRFLVINADKLNMFLVLDR